MRREGSAAVEAGAHRQLPYAATWLDYCDFALLAPESSAGSMREMRALLDRLSNVTASEASRRRKALLRVRDAFIARPPTQPDSTGSPSGSPSSPVISTGDFMLREACSLAYRAKPWSRRGEERRGEERRAGRQKVRGTRSTERGDLMPESSEGRSFASAAASLERCQIAGKPMHVS